MTSAKGRAIVIATDYSPSSDLAVHRGFELANRLDGATPHVVFVASTVQSLPPGIMAPTPPIPPPSDEIREELERYTRAQLERFEKENGPARFGRAVTHVRMGAPADEISRLARELGADMVVVGTHGRRGMRRALMGSVAEVVVRKAPCAVFVVRPFDDAVMEDREPPSSGERAAEVSSEGGDSELEDESAMANGAAPLVSLPPF